ncbi:PAS domain-containing sensor histidine kinase [Pontibacter sp. SGAir0037]|uniref:sensor histidine kinase n=1 Tax=Pontibacter sp. SGAir0037 TaxID=2571030 RepID=UPI0010CCF9D7|nr:ATP-binding protein [Pontibacter sp. SGAir0037]QCR23594.1 ATP-binding protein [Pontibacter sp. SGAir0037]
MIFKRLELGLLVRLTFIFAIMYLTLYYLVQFTWLQTASGILIILAQIVELTRYVTRSNNELARFLESVKQRDFSQHFNEQRTNSSLRQLHHAFNQINLTFKQLHIEREEQFQYMQIILQLIDTGIMAYNEQGEVEWVNDAFKEILGIPYLKNIKALELRNEKLYQAVLALEPQQNKLLKLKLPGGPTQLLLTSVDFMLQQRLLTLVAFKNVSSAVDETETEAWQKLLRVMTHEIMNSVAPIASLAESMGRYLKADREQYEAVQQEQPNKELLQDTEEGLAIIKGRSEGLLRFTHFYRNLNKSQQLLYTTIYVQELFSSIEALMKPRLAEKGIQLSWRVSSPELTIQGDVNLLEQVLINMVLNAERAVLQAPAPQIELEAREQENGKAVLEIRDNGSGIPEEIMESIFIPFFTSHKEGTGIGLSLAKQIILLHKGSIQVTSDEGVGTVFRLTF